MKSKINFLSAFLFFVLIFSCSTSTKESELKEPLFDESQIINEADQYLAKAPTPLTQFVCERSEGGPNDFYSEGDYWWPNPDDLEGPYIRKDGQTNPENFVAHRLAMRDLGRWVAALTAAYLITNDRKYADKANAHLQAWFSNPETQMNPSLLYAQAIKGKVTGRGIGIIDTIHLIEVAKSIELLHSAGYLSEEDFSPLKNWFNQFATWLTTHPYGLDEKDHGNNHSTWWAAQVAAFAKLADRSDIMETCRSQYKKLLTAQMDLDGGFPDELDRTKPYNYSLFNLEGYAVLAEIASSPSDHLWDYETPKGSLKTAIDFMIPFIKDQSTWPFTKDVEHFEELPIQSASLFLAAEGYDESNYLNIWRKLPKERQSKEVDRTYPIRQLYLWQ